MRAVLTQQLDFILCFYGLAFILLGVVCLGLSRRAQVPQAWHLMGAFGLVHGLVEWLDLLALVGGDTPGFAQLRLAVMTASFVAMAEAGRLSLRARGRPAPPRWIHVPLLAIVALLALTRGLADANAAARYLICLPGALAMALSGFAVAAKLPTPRERHLASGCAAAFACYGVAAGLIVPQAMIGPATVLHQEAFLEVTGMPVQLLRGVIACVLAFLTWAVWSEKAISQTESESYAGHVRRHLVVMAFWLVAVLGGGWLLTDRLGDHHRRHLESEAAGLFDLLTGRFAAEMTIADASARALASAPLVREALRNDAFARADTAAVTGGLAVGVEAASGLYALLLDRHGHSIAASRLDGGPGGLGSLDPTVAAHAERMVAGPDRRFTRGPRGGALYHATAPAPGPDGTVLGYVSIKKEFAPLAAELHGLAQMFVLADASGTAVMSNRAEAIDARLWPASDQVHAGRPLFTQPLGDGAWTTLAGKRGLVRRAELGDNGWSLVMVLTPEVLLAGRLLGLIVTVLGAAALLIYAVGRERAAHDSAQTEKRHDLELLARNLDRQASTDALTGVFNRLKFDQELAIQILKAQRGGAALSLLMFDIDHFKAVNDRHGHQAGDEVLRNVATLVAQNIRPSDILARWGGEEFVIVAPQTTLAMARSLAESLRLRIAGARFGHVGTVTCSFGVTQFEITDSMDSLVARADGALYGAKIGGRNRVEAIGGPVAGPAAA
jgi:diguanylate cyclase (GGDEF)-like protein